MARRGIGIGIVGDVVGDKDDLVVPVLRDKLSFEFPVWLVAPVELRTSRRVRIVFDLLAEVLGQRKTPEPA